MATCLFVGRVDHTRLRPRLHSFRYRVAMLYLDLAALDGDLARFPWLLGKWFSPLRFRRGDHLGAEHEPLAVAVRRLIATRAGVEPQGPIHLLTGFGFMAWRFNPVSFYYCFNRAGDAIDFVVAEVTNTPWRERHCYVLDFRGSAPPASGEPLLEVGHGKGFHVSPFMPMDTRYLWQVGVPGEQLALAIAVERGGEPLFSAGLDLERRPFSRAELWRAFAHMPFTTLKVVAAIHWQALRLWLKGVPFHPHPGSLPTHGGDGDTTTVSGDRP